MTKAEEIFEKHIGSNAELGYIPIKKEDVIDAINEALSHKVGNDGLCECTDPCEKTLAMKCTGCGSLTECK